VPKFFPGPPNDMEIIHIPDDQFFSPIPTSSVPISEDRTQPFSTTDSNVNPYSGTTYMGKYIRATKWISFLVMGYVLNRIVVNVTNFPADAQHHTWLGHCRNVADMVLLGFVQCWYTDLLDVPSRWDYILKDGYFIFIFLASNLLFSIVTSIPGFDEGFSEDSHDSLFFLFVIFTVAVWVCYTIIWHVVYSKKVIPIFKEFLSFWLFRLGTFGVLGITYYVIHSDKSRPEPDGAKLHLHHYFVAWLISLIASFNHRISTTVLAITSGIFVQGISVYSAASMFYRGVKRLHVRKSTINR
jgi:hypothetical protein